MRWEGTIQAIIHSQEVKCTNLKIIRKWANKVKLSVGLAQPLPATP